MEHDPSLKPGFYWVRFEGEVIVAEYTATRFKCDGQGCVDGTFHWHIPGSSDCWMDVEICERLSGRLVNAI